MPLTPEMRSGIDRIRDYLYGGGYPDPLSNAEQLAFLFFFYLIEGIDADNAVQAKGLRRDYRSVFAGDWQLRNPLNAPARIGAEDLAIRGSRVGGGGCGEHGAGMVPDLAPEARAGSRWRGCGHGLHVDTLVGHQLDRTVTNRERQSPHHRAAPSRGKASWHGVILNRAGIKTRSMRPPRSRGPSRNASGGGRRRARPHRET